MLAMLAGFEGIAITIAVVVVLVVFTLILFLSRYKK